jgi:chitinase
VALMTQYGFDGLDIDWEFPVEGGLDDGRPADKRNFTLLLARLRYQLDQQGLRDDRHYLLTIAAPQSIQFYENMELSRIHEHLDWLNLMTYTYNGGWSEATNHHAPLFASAADPSEYRADFNVDATVRAYLAAGVPPEKLVIGLPFYGHGWSGVENVNHGLFQPFEGLPEATWGDGIYDYADLSANYVGVFIRFWDPSAQVPWLYSASDQIMISYDDPTSLRAKADYVRAHTLGGVMIWELAYDDDTHTLLDAVYRRLTAP